MSENHLHNPAELQSISGMNSLTALVLENNPLSEQVNQDVVGFAGSLRKLFPNLQTLVMKLWNCDLLGEPIAEQAPR